jgi:nitroreductase
MKKTVTGNTFNFDTINTLFHRRSIREYNNNEVKKDLLNVILLAAMHAPSYENRQPWHFIVVNDELMLNFLKDSLDDIIKINSKAIIIVCADTKKDNHKGWWIQDCAAATQNILLAVHSLGLVSTWYGLHPIKHLKELLKRKLNLPGNIQPFSLITLGYPKNKVNSDLIPSRFVKEKVHFNGW